MSDLLNYAEFTGLAVHLLLIAVCMRRVWRGDNAADRLIGVDLVSVLSVSVLLLLALVTEESIFVDVALVLAALGFISTVLLAKYIADDSAA